MSMNLMNHGGFVYPAKLYRISVTHLLAIIYIMVSYTTGIVMPACNV